MEQKTEALYLINGDKFLHLRENGAGVRADLQAESAAGWP